MSRWSWEKHATRAAIDWEKDVLFVNAHVPKRAMMAVLDDEKLLQKCRRIALGRELFYDVGFGLTDG